jgi:hypothetical protein
MQKINNDNEVNIRKLKERLTNGLKIAQIKRALHE